ncbi:ribonuclease [Corynebacterium hindlerae]|uniref:Ribonuclease n=1 Tax=Corynebacterium hindlerae TaxID=699041 RepID=A0A7G5FE90_9CORY|nr:ribonuclease domain-containing protein [Corynebacterium hindlerae]QMV84931.1 ribonuclease [Corynebacterium hindlerae]
MASTFKTLAGLGGAAVVLAAAFFGLDLGENAPDQEPKQTSVVRSDNECPVATLPAEVNPVIDGILGGKKPKYPENDGVRFGNYEGHLPKKDKNYYREYTVDTPGLNHRGERRIITGGGTKADPEVWYYTDDHYESFCEIPDAE